VNALPWPVKRLRLSLFVEMGLLALCILVLAGSAALNFMAASSSSVLLPADQRSSFLDGVLGLDAWLLLGALLAGVAFALVARFWLRLLRGLGGLRPLIAAQVACVALGALATAVLNTGDSLTAFEGLLFAGGPLVGLALLLTPSVRSHAVSALPSAAH